MTGTAGGQRGAGRDEPSREERSGGAETTGKPDRPRPDGEDGGQDTPRASSLTRRQFAAGTGAALLLPVASGLAPWPRPGGQRGSGATREESIVAGAPGPGAPPARRRAPQEGEEEPPGTDALVEYVRARWGDRLSDDELEQIRSSVAGQLRAASSIAEVPLENGDGPATAFRAYRGEGP